MVDSVDRQEQKNRLTERAVSLGTANEWFKRPGWKLVLECVSALEAKYLDQLFKTKDANEIFHLQGQILGLRTLSKLPTKFENELREANLQLAEMDKGSKGD